MDESKAKSAPACVCMPWDSVSALNDLVTSRMEGKIDYISTGFISLDSKLDGGFEASQFILLAARPSAGKSTLAQQIAEYVAEIQGVAVLFIALEVGNSEFVRRSVTRRTGIPMRSIKKGTMNAVQYEMYKYACEKYRNLPFYTAHSKCNDPKTLNKVVTEMDEWLLANNKQKIGMVVVDYLQLMTADGASRVESVGEISRSLKKLAQDKNIPVIALAQMNREIEKRINKRPVLSDLRESGALEQDANIVMFISREDDDDQPDALKVIGLKKVKIIIAKNRDGEVCDVDMVWDPSKMTFIEPDTETLKIIKEKELVKDKPIKRKRYEQKI